MFDCIGAWCGESEDRLRTDGLEIGFRGRFRGRPGFGPLEQLPEQLQQGEVAAKPARGEGVYVQALHVAPWGREEIGAVIVLRDAEIGKAHDFIPKSFAVHEASVVAPLGAIELGAVAEHVYLGVFPFEQVSAVRDSNEADGKAARGGVKYRDGCLDPLALQLGKRVLVENLQALAVPAVMPQLEYLPFRQGLSRKREQGIGPCTLSNGLDLEKVAPMG